MKVKLFLILILSIIIYSCSDDDNSEIVDDCPFELVNLTLYNNESVNLIDDVTISRNSEYLVALTSGSVTLSTIHFEPIDTIIGELYRFRCQWISDTIVRYRYNDYLNWYNYNIKTNESEIITNPNYSIRTLNTGLNFDSKCEIFLEDEWVTVIDTTAPISSYHLSPEQNRIVLNVGWDKISVYEIIGKTISELSKLSHNGVPIGWIDNDYYIFFDLVQDDNLNFIESEYYISKYDCSVFWKVTNSEILKMNGSVSINKVIFFTRDPREGIYIYDILRK